MWTSPHKHVPSLGEKPLWGRWEEAYIFSRQGGRRESWPPGRQPQCRLLTPLPGTDSPDLGVFWQASCHGDVNVQHHPLEAGPPPKE